MLKLNEIYLGDCLQLLKDIPDKSIDLCLTDPPYGIGCKYLSYDDTKENLVRLIKQFMPEVLRVSKRVAIFCGVQNIWLYPQADWIMSYSWNTTATYGKMGYSQWQPILFYGNDIKGYGSVNGVLKSDSIHLSGGGGAFGGCLGVFDFPKDKHPCPKPETIINRLILRLSNERDLVLDPMIGSGTTAIACIKHNRNFIGMELDLTYVAAARERVKQELMQLRLEV